MALLLSYIIQAACCFVPCGLSGVLQEESGYIGAVFSFLSCGRVREAVALASKHRDHRLASLIAQGGWGNPALMNLCREQLSEWERQNVSQCIVLHAYIRHTCVAWQWSLLVGTFARACQWGVSHLQATQLVSCLLSTNVL